MIRHGYAAPECHEEPTLPTPNYAYEKRQRELAKKRKAEEKRQRKLQRTDGGAPADDTAADESAPQPATEGAPPAPVEPGR